MREFTLYNHDETESIALNGSILATDVSGLGTQFALKKIGSSTHTFEEDYQDIELKLNFGVGSSAYAEYKAFMDFIGRNGKNNLVLKYDYGIVNTVENRIAKKLSYECVGPGNTLTLKELFEDCLGFSSEMNTQQDRDEWSVSNGSVSSESWLGETWLKLTSNGSSNQSTIYRGGLDFPGTWFFVTRLALKHSGCINTMLFITDGENEWDDYGYDGSLQVDTPHTLSVVITEAGSGVSIQLGQVYGTSASGKDLYVDYIRGYDLEFCFGGDPGIATLRYWYQLYLDAKADVDRIEFAPYLSNARYCDVWLKNAPKTQKNEFGILAETFSFERATPWYEKVSTEYSSSLVEIIDNKHWKDLELGFVLSWVSGKASQTAYLKNLAETLTYKRVTVDANNSSAVAPFDVVVDAESKIVNLVKGGVVTNFYQFVLKAYDSFITIPKGTFKLILSVPSGGKAVVYYKKWLLD